MTGVPRKRVAAPVYRWTVTDHRMTQTTTGEAASVARAQADAIAELRRIGRGLQGVQATVFRPGGGGWFCRHLRGARGSPPTGFSWEAWEPLD